jgi:hypothetical protein
VLARDGLPEGSTDLVTLFIVSHCRDASVGGCYLRTVRSGGEPVGSILLARVLCCGAASGTTRGFVDPEMWRNFCVRAVRTISRMVTVVSR